jgi:hypothetical protein
MNLVPLTKPPAPGDVVYHENHGLVKYEVTDQYAGVHRKQYPEIVLLRVLEDFGDGFFSRGHLSLRPLEELMRDADAPKVFTK